MSSAKTEAQPLQEERTTRQHFFVLHIKFIARTFGLLTVAVMWISTVVCIEDRRDNYVGWYLIAASALVTFFEVTWILNKSACCGNEGCCCRIWRGIMWIDNWKKFIIYLAISVPLFLEGMQVALGIVSGFLLVLLSMLYLVKTFLGTATIRYEKTEKRLVTSTKTPAQEISTQTESEHYYLDYSSTADTPPALQRVVDETKPSEQSQEKKQEKFK